MSMTDPIADFLTRIRNGVMARKDTIDCPRSKIKLRIAEILRDEGYVDAVTSIDNEHQGTLTVKLRYASGSNPAITGVRRASRPGQRRYSGSQKIPKVRNGLGISIISTSKGLMTDRRARQLGVGGEILCEVW